MEHELGAAWVGSGRSCALKVPSLAIEGEWNVLLNPVHAEFAKIISHQPRPFHFDERMFKSMRHATVADRDDPGCHKLISASRAFSQLL